MGVTSQELLVNLLLIPILVSALGACLFLLAAVAGCNMLFFRRTASIGKHLLIYATASLTAGLAGCWLGFPLMLRV